MKYLKSPKKIKFQDEELIAKKNTLDLARSTYKICSKKFRIFKDYRTSARQKQRIQTTYDLLQNQIKKYKEFAEKKKLNVDENILYLEKLITGTKERHKKPVEEVISKNRNLEKSKIIIKETAINHSNYTIKRMLKDFEIVRSKQLKSIQNIGKELAFVNRNEEELRKLKSKLKEKAEYIKIQIAEANNKDKELDAEIKELETIKHQTKKEIREKQNEIIEVRKAIQIMMESVKEVRQSYKKNIENYNDEMQKIKEEMDAINADLNAKELELEAKRKNRDNIIKEICDKEKSINELKKCVEHLQNSNRMKDNELCNKVRIKNELLAVGFQTKKTLEKLKKEIAEAAQKNKIMKQDIMKASECIRMKQVHDNIKRLAAASRRLQFSSHHSPAAATDAGN
ncbi:hypothetical protein HF086_009633 [Spodoptera exigua]|uniref:Uncharacterized protein n=1 Tax=Spodoptera exigua TaxID=7107 RepID=A0A922MT73_SPOEX|nr:hypothetical protein HF086_009633 [Spodoptera exigua]